MKPRYAVGDGNAPVHLVLIQREKTGGGVLVFAGGTIGTHSVAFQSESDLHAKLNRLLKRAVPLSVGGPVPGPAEEVAMLIDLGTLKGPYVEISWSRPRHWTVREIIEGAVEWQCVPSADAFATVDFDLTSIDGAFVG